MKLLVAKTEHMADILSIIEDGRQTLRELGIAQWQQKYPSIVDIEVDIQAGNSYLLLHNEQIIGTVALLTTEEIAYKDIHGGQWHATLPYLTIHRLAIAKHALGNGIGTVFLKKIEEMAQQKGRTYIRLDTHKKNERMKYIVEKNGYQFAGKVSYGNDFSCCAYDKLLGDSL
ncbi:MAG: GNAT family N-acetyltransferase [Kurthia sp.]|nr:GNAT family N-acetyltransferase [Candidatus Kurthia equi]